MMLQHGAVLSGGGWRLVPLHGSHGLVVYCLVTDGDIHRYLVVLRACRQSVWALGDGVGSWMILCGRALLQVLGSVIVVVCIPFAMTITRCVIAAPQLGL